MSEQKYELLELLQTAVLKLLRGSLVYHEITKEGFLCDFDLTDPLNPDKIKLIESWLADKDISCPFEIMSFSGAYMDGNSSLKMLQRIYVCAFETCEELARYKADLLEAATYDHKKIGTEQKLFSSSEHVGQGLMLWHPRGAALRMQLEQFSQAAHILNGYQWVYTPHIGRSQLWETSEHLENFKENMYNPIDIDKEQYYLKPMNCPFHFIIYNSEIHSYRELPLRLAEFGSVYRYELSGVLNGLARVRGFTQDDAHIFCTPEQVEDEVMNALNFSLYILRSFGLTKFKAYISTKPETKAIGSDELWQDATDVLIKAIVSSGLEYEIDEGGGAFYGPKIDLKLYDIMGREWQCSTIQFDFNLPERFNVGYIDRDGSRHTPTVIHRALFGSIERFIAILIEHYRGEFPLWLAPIQFAIVPINHSHNDYCKKLEIELKKLGLRVVGDYSEDHMRQKIKKYEVEKIQYILVVGDKEVAAGGFSVRSRKEGNLGIMKIDQLLAYTKDDLDQGNAKYILEEKIL